MALVQSVDVLGPLGNNPRLFGQAAAANALSDIYAMGGRPWSVMHVVSFPATALPLEMLVEMLSGSMEKTAEAGAVLAGGHTLEDKEVKLGLSVTGIVDPGAIARNSNLRPGDVLVLTKPLGTGVLATAIKANWPGADAAETELYRWTTRLNARAADVLREMRLSCATDITGFGLGGHVLEMARGSGVSVELDTSAFPFMTQAEDFASDGLVPGSAYANRKHVASETIVSQHADSLRALLAFDPQTSGGLLLAVPRERQDEALERLEKYGERGWIVGRAVSLRENGRLLLC